MIGNIKQINAYYDSDSGQSQNGYYSEERKKEKQIEKNSQSKKTFKNLPVGKATSSFDVKV